MASRSGEWRHYDERLTMFLLRNRRPARFGNWVDKLIPLQPLDQQDTDCDLDGKLDQIEFRAEDFEEE